MMEDLNRFKERWESLGMDCVLSEMVGERGILKFHRKTESPNSISVMLSGKDLACLDIDNFGDSMKNFLAVVEREGMDLEEYLIEKTLHNGYHIFFRMPNSLKKKNLYANEHLGVKYDILHRGRVFTTPSSYKTRGYNFLKKDPFSIQSLDEIQDYKDPLISIFINAQPTGDI